MLTSAGTCWSRVRAVSNSISPATCIAARTIVDVVEIADLLAVGQPGGLPATPSIDQVRQETMNVLVSPEDVERPQVDERHPIDAIQRG